MIAELKNKIVEAQSNIKRLDTVLAQLPKDSPHRASILQSQEILEMRVKELIEKLQSSGAASK